MCGHASVHSFTEAQFCHVDQIEIFRQLHLESSEVYFLEGRALQNAIAVHTRLKIQNNLLGPAQFGSGSINLPGMRSHQSEHGQTEDMVPITVKNIKVQHQILLEIGDAHNYDCRYLTAAVFC